MFIRFASTLIFIGFLTSCNTVQPWMSQEIIQPRSFQDAQIMATDMVDVLIEEYPPGKTIFSLYSPQPGIFGEVFEKKLRESGFAVSVPDDRNEDDYILKMAYILDTLEEPDTYRLGISVEPDYRIDRLYKVDRSDNLVSTTSITVRNNTDRSK
jgi:hypothetical protein